MTGYNQEHDVLFVHVPKTAGSSIEHAPFVSGMGHEPYWSLPEAMRERAGFSFAFVRNPYSRFVSIVTEGFYTVMRAQGEEPKTPEDEQRVFERAQQLVHYAASQAPAEGELQLGTTERWNILGKQDDPLPHLEGFAWPIHYVPQHYFVSEPGMTGIGVGFLGRFEQLQQDWQRVCDRVGVPFELPHKRNAQKNRRRHYSEFYTPEIQDVVRRCYRRDFEVFGYDPDDLGA